MLFADLDDERMEFVEVLRARERNRPAFDEGTFDCDADFIVGRGSGKNLVPGEEPLRIGVHDEDWIVAGVQQNGVCGFRADAIKREQLLPEYLDFGGGS